MRALDLAQAAPLTADDVTEIRRELEKPVTDIGLVMSMSLVSIWRAAAARLVATLDQRGLPEEPVRGSTPERETHHYSRLIRRNGVWGSCVDCPTHTAGGPSPETCRHWTRYDHRLLPEAAQGEADERGNRLREMRGRLTDVMGTINRLLIDWRIDDYHKSDFFRRVFHYHAVPNQWDGSKEPCRLCLAWERFLEHVAKENEALGMGSDFPDVCYLDQGPGTTLVPSYWGAWIRSCPEHTHERPGLLDGSSLVCQRCRQWSSMVGSKGEPTPALEASMAKVSHLATLGVVARFDELAKAWADQGYPIVQGVDPPSTFMSLVAMRQAALPLVLARMAQDTPEAGIWARLMRPLTCSSSLKGGPSDYPGSDQDGTLPKAWLGWARKQGIRW